MAITTLAELTDSIQRWLDNDNPNLVASIPDMITLFEAEVGRQLHTRDMECLSTHPVVPTGTADEDRGVYDLPADWGGHVMVNRSGSDIRILYWRKIPALSDSNPSNWLLTKYPDVYLYGSLAHAEGFLKNDPRVELWATAAQSGLLEIEDHDVQDKFSGGPLRTRTGRERPWIGLTRGGEGRYDYLPKFDFFDLVGSGLNQVNETDKDCVGYFTVAESKLRMWPVPGDDPAGAAGWSACV